jgi:hypothetical protein
MKMIRSSSFWRDLKSVIDYFDDVHAERVALDPSIDARQPGS